MCGISGIVSKKNFDTDYFFDISKKHLSKRGPDNQDIYVNKKNNLALFHARLSIIDIDNRSNQPNSFYDDQYIITYNGEIYNFKKLKKKLISNDVKFVTNSDTEVVLKYIKFFGIKKSLIDFDGMFAFAIFDKINNSLYLARDRLGQKPLYYFYDKDNNDFIFSSEIYVIKDLLKNKIEISPKNLKFYLSLSYFPKDKTVYENVNKLIAGNYLKYKLSDNNLESNIYWKPNFNKIINQDSEKKIIDNCEKVILDSLEQTLISDVPVSFYISSGTDSSLLCALTKKCLNKDVRAYSLVNQDEAHDESQDVKKISQHLNIETNYIGINSSSLIHNIEKNIDIYQEPFADSSQIALTFLNNHIKEKVVISGDGGDELFGGYNRHQWLPKIYKYNSIYFKILFKILFFTISIIGKDRIDNKIMTKIFKEFFIYDKTKKFLKACLAKNELSSYLSIISKNYNYLQYDDFIETIYSDIWSQDLSNFDKIRLSDIDNYLIDDILVKVDRSCMFNSIENRTPYLNNNVFEFSQTLPFKYKIRNNEKKWILKKILERYLPSELIYKPKRGFKIPIGYWMTNDLKNYFEKKLVNIKKQKFCNYDNFFEYWNDHLKNKNNNEDLLWNYFFFSIWLEKNNP
tara:strand:- start:679 stop:2565 length:1887 start_codon:yes stop_codon:yes gene_type:complete